MSLHYVHATCPGNMSPQHVLLTCHDNIAPLHVPTTSPRNMSPQYVRLTCFHNISPQGFVALKIVVVNRSENYRLKAFAFGRSGCLRRHATFVAFFGIFISRPLNNHDMKFPHAMFYGSYKYAAKSFPFSSRHVLRRLQICRVDFFPSLLRLN